MRGLVSLDQLTPRMAAHVRRYFFRLIDYEEANRGLDGYITEQALERFIREELKVPNLFPDQSRTSYTGSADFIFASPIQEQDWKQLEPMASFCMNTTKTPFVHLPKGSYNADCDVTILLRRDYETDDDMLEAAAWLRMAKNVTSRIYACGSYRELSMYERLMKTAGVTAAHRALSIMYDLPRAPKKKKP